MGIKDQKIETGFNGKAEIKWGEIEYRSWDGRSITFTSRGSIVIRHTGYIWSNTWIKTEEDFQNLWDVLEEFAVKQIERRKEKAKDE